ncbi:unnamed protein product [Meganyctiphanes norvegica]|uniref:Uncharacterized protein n=1 Tax=Meganyctiphanes norvegica TaxID=48144 RepID=A0AAV2PHL2_MEGNR
MPYIELDHRLKSRKLEDINDDTPLPDPKRDASNQEPRGFGFKDTFKVNKYHTIEKKHVQPLIPEVEKYKLQVKKEQDEMKRHYNSRREECKEDSNGWKKEDEILLEELEPVLGPEKEVYFDQDWGLFSAVLACYNNHWVLKSGPDDWWTVVNHKIASALDDHGDVEAIRNFFVDHEGQKKININVGPTLSNIDYSWLFTQFSSEIRRNIKTPGFVDLMQTDFSTTSPQQLIISQIMLMASVKKYFAFGCYTMCGIPGVEMQGNEKDWELLIDKFNDLEKLLEPIIDDLKLELWFKSTKVIFTNLLKTYKGQPDKEWWSHILCWNETYGSGARSWWSGWFPEFLGCENNPEGPNDFPSGLVTVPLHIEDKNNGPPVEDDGLLVAGTLGFTVNVENNETPVVEPHNTWSLLLPVNSPVTPRLKPHIN